MATAPDLATFDWIVVNSSAGKDSQAMLDYVVGLAHAADVIDRVLVVHADLGRVEWEGTRELAEEQAAHYGLRFEVYKRAQGDLLDHIQSRGKFPSSTARFCTSDHKRGQIGRLHTALAKESREAGVSGRPVRILNCMGFRAQESAARAKRQVVEVDKRNTNGRKHVTNWLPIHEWLEPQVWEQIAQSGTRYHPAYDLGMPRLSCCFCIFAPREALLIAGKANPDLLAEYAAVEAEIGHQFRGEPGKKGSLSLADIVDALAAGEDVEAKVTAWGNQ